MYVCVCVCVCVCCELNSSIRIVTNDCKKDNNNNSSSSNNNNNEYLERLTRTGPKRLHVLYKYIFKNAYNMNAHTHARTVFENISSGARVAL